jgi:hypothetical protein
MKFYATGHFQMTDSDLAGVHQTTASQLVKQVSRAIAQQREHFISFPGIIGAIDGSHVRISCPGVMM